MYRVISVILLVLLSGGCSTADKNQELYPHKHADTSGRKAGAAMLLYEQAEEEMDVNSNVTVTPPAEKKIAE